MKAAKGHVFKYGDNVDTDVIIPARYLNSSDPKDLALHYVLRQQVSAALSQRRLQESSIVMRSISDFRSLNVRRRQKRSKLVTKWKSTLTQE